MSHSTPVGALLAKQFRADGKLPAYGVGARHGAVLAESPRPERLLLLDQFADGMIDGKPVRNAIVIRNLPFLGSRLGDANVNAGDGFREILFPY